MNIQTVDYTNEDLQRLVQSLDHFFNEKWGEDIANSYQSFHQLSQMAYACVAYEDYAVGCGCFKIMDEQTVEIKRMYVDPDYRHRGIATRILKHLEDVALSQGKKYCVLETGKDMLDNIQFYEKCGYHLIDNYGDFIGDEICICMMKVLNSK